MEILLFSGFLGSGKTTLILALARRVSELHRSACVIVNEVGEISIDGGVLADGGLEVYELCAGCICCQIGVDLVRTLEEVESRYHPDLVIIEASGVATPGGVLAALSYFEAAPTSVCCVSLVDPTRLSALLDVMQPLVESQVREADEIVISKIDASTADELTLARAAVTRLAPTTPTWELDVTDPASVETYINRRASIASLADLTEEPR